MPDTMQSPASAKGKILIVNSNHSSNRPSHDEGLDLSPTSPGNPGRKSITINRRQTENLHPNVLTQLAAAADSNNRPTSQPQASSDSDIGCLTITTEAASSPSNAHAAAEVSRPMCTECHDNLATLQCFDCDASGKLLCVDGGCNRSVHNTTELRRHKRQPLPGFELPPPTPSPTANRRLTLGQSNGLSSPSARTLGVPSAAATSSAELSSVDADNNCDHCATQLPTLYCYDCVASYCHSCNTRIHKSTEFREHMQLPVEQVDENDKQTVSIKAKPAHKHFSNALSTSARLSLNHGASLALTDSPSRPRTAVSRFSKGNTATTSTLPEVAQTIAAADVWTLDEKEDSSSRPSTSMRSLQFSTDDLSASTSQKQCSECKVRAAEVYCKTCSLYFCDNEASGSCSDRVHKLAGNAGHKIYLIQLPPS